MESKAKNKMKHSTFRLLIQALFFALTNGYAQGFLNGKIYGGENKWLCVPGLNCYSCPGALFACPIGSLQAVLNSSTYKLSCYVFGFIMATGALFGRLVCGFMCPFGLVQDLLYKIPFFKKLKNLPGHKYLKYIRYVVLVVFVFLLSGLIVNDAGTGKPWYCEYICPSGTLFASIPLVAMNESLQEIIGWKFFLKLSILLVTLLLAVISFRPFCKYICPLGAMYGVCNPVSIYRYRVDDNKCVSCGACQRACGMDIKVWKNPNSTECIRCGECKAACPTGAISTSFEDLRGKLIRPLPKEQSDIEENIASKRRSGTNIIAPDEKKNVLNIILGIIICAMALISICIYSFDCLSVLVGAFTGSLPTSDFVSAILLYGTVFMAFFTAVIFFKSGNMIVNNKGRLTATQRATRIFALATIINAILLLAQEIIISPLIALVCLSVFWASLAILLLLLLNCHFMKKADK